LGCELLAKRLNVINPIAHLCGHIHSSYGSKKINNTWYYNASMLDEDYKYYNKPINIEI
jgi:Icc-related predicted phosphoesterase